MNLKRIKDEVMSILTDKTTVRVEEHIPLDDKQFKYDNGVESWTTSIFVDIIKSEKLFKDQKKDIVARIIRAYSIGIISIMSANENYREIGIRGDCVFGVFSCPLKSNIYDVFNTSVKIHMFLKMLNVLVLKQLGIKIEAGIGIGTSKTLIVKVGKPTLGVNDKVWIGDAVINASRLSEKSNRSYGTIKYEKILIDDCTYSNIIELYEKENANARSWFYQQYVDSVLCYGCNIIYSDDDEWIEGGMN